MHHLNTNRWWSQVDIVLSMLAKSVAQNVLFMALHEMHEILDLDEVCLRWTFFVVHASVLHVPLFHVAVVHVAVLRRHQLSDLLCVTCPTESRSLVRGQNGAFLCARGWLGYFSS
jgi:hypothetical protein